MKRRSSPARRREAVRNDPVSFETLENRQQMAVTVGYDAAAKAVVITGDAGSNFVEVSQVSATEKRVVVPNRTPDGPVNKIFDQSVKEVVFRGGAGNDTFVNRTGIACKA